MGASGEGGARTGAGSEDGADSSGETGATRPTLRPQSCHEGDVAEREPEAGLTGTLGSARVTFDRNLFIGIILIDLYVLSSPPCFLSSFPSLSVYPFLSSSSSCFLYPYYFLSSLLFVPIPFLISFSFPLPSSPLSLFPPLSPPHVVSSVSSSFPLSSPRFLSFVVPQDNFGFDLQAVEAATKKHEAIETDIAAYEERVQVSPSPARLV